MEQNIIDRDTINKYYALSKNIDQDRVNSQVLRAQQDDLAVILGEPLYYAFIEDYDGAIFTSQRFIDLFGGTSYTYKNNTVYFRGVESLLSSYSYSRLLGINKTNLVRAGVTYKVVEESETLEDFEIRNKARAAQSDAIRLEGDLEKYLDEMLGTYPEYRERDILNPKHTSFNFDKVRPGYPYYNRALLYGHDPDVKPL